MTTAQLDPTATPAKTAPWWRSAVIYQIYPRSFADANGDGMGDLNGVRSRLPYLAALGVDALWLSPFYASPQADAGYDVSDYRDVDPSFGTLDDARALIRETHEHHLRIVVDLVPNHTSDQHVWFQAALAAPPGSAERARYIFREGRGPTGELPPNNWTSNFGGPAWTRVPDGSWYLHLFAPEQPDLDWTNPEVVAEFQSILRFWLDLGVDGFRIDVAHGLAKDPALTDISDNGYLLTAASNGDHPFWDRDEVHDVYRGWREVIDEYGDDRIFVAEAWVPNPDRFAQYLRPDELHTAFNFNYLQAGWDAAATRKVIDQTLGELRDVGAPATWVLSNHDVVRHVTRYGGGDLGRRRARAATALMLALPGGAYIYQGEELGLEEVLDIPAELRQDPIFEQTNGERLGRDGCRVPLPWSGASAPFGFGPTGTPWLPQPADWAAETAEAEEADPGSSLWFYRTALAQRRRNPALGEGDLRWLETAEGVLAFRRGADFACVINFTDAPVALPTELIRAAVTLASSAADEGVVPAATALWLTI
ncbi:alpha-glucosidase [Nakamurella panacisegetis]|uniref:Alpha-glucosidase n=1 Tax=Nakamurella panacisegetis TaxID=1090615 RepID=A0A1H0QT62_9ACTN|nr:glycoside hydrolase family 13 protein [Nakamurella panacisegetis]SDP20380.1 alpha-glucosidase [Nakamurella panacisegetis]